MAARPGDAMVDVVFLDEDEDEHDSAPGPAGEAPRRRGSERSGGPGAPGAPRADDGSARADDGSPGADDGALDAPRRPGPLARRRRPAALVGAALAVAVATAAGVSTVRAEAEARRLTELPGFVESLEDPLTEAWRVEAPEPVWTTSALLLRLGDGGLVAHELTTGVERWSATLDGAAPEDVEACVGTATAGPDGAAPVVVCHVAGPDRLVVLDADDGAALGVLDGGTGVLGLAPVDGDVVRVTGGPAVVERVDPRTGDVRWSTDLPQGVGRSAMAVEHGLVTFSGDVAAVVDGADGRLLGSWPGTDVRVPTGVAAASVRAMPGGFGVRIEQRRRFADPEWRWFERDGSPVATVEGFLAEPHATDHSVPSVTLTVTDTPVLRAVEIGDGLRWAARPQDGLPVVRVDGAVVLASAGVLRSVALEDGITRWSVALEPGDAVSSVSDGRNVLVLSSREGEGRSLAALSLEDGAVVWSERIPDTYRSFEPGTGGDLDVVLARDGTAVVGLR